MGNQLGGRGEVGTGEVGKKIGVEKRLKKINNVE